MSRARFKQDLFIDPQWLHDNVERDNNRVCFSIHVLGYLRCLNRKLTSNLQMAGRCSRVLDIFERLAPLAAPAK